MSGFTINEIEKLLDSKSTYLPDQEPEIISNFEYVVSNLPNTAETAMKTAFISISRNRWNQVTLKETNWTSGNEAILKHLGPIGLIITEKPIPELLGSIAQIIVQDSFEALLSLAREARRKMNHPVIGITGSVGKSTTRLLFEHLLGDSRSFIATRGNHNTRTGVPLYCAKLASDPSVGILEISLNALNNRGNLAELVRPDICIVTSVGEAHLSTLHSTTTVATFKARIFDGLTKDGLAIINADIPTEEFQILKKRAGQRTRRIRTYSLHDQTADLHATCITHAKDGTHVAFSHKGETYEFTLSLSGEGTVQNTLGVLLCLMEMGEDPAPLLPKLKSFSSLPKVMERKTLITPDNRQIEVIDDSHNAAIPSMINAIQAFKAKRPFYRGRGLLVLGQVADLGKQAESLHEKLLPVILDSGADFVFGHGPLMRNAIKQLPEGKIGGWFNHAQDLAAHLPLYCTDDSLVLLKGSVTGSDFSKTGELFSSEARKSKSLLFQPTAVQLSEVLQPHWGARVYELINRKKPLLTSGNADSRSIEGLAPLLLWEAAQSKRADWPDAVELQAWPTNPAVSRTGRELRTGNLFSFTEMVEELTFSPHPSLVFEVANRLFGNRRLAMQAVTKIADRLGLGTSAALNLTGRYRKKEVQGFGLDDLAQIGKHLSNRASLMPLLPIESPNEVRGLVTGRLRLSCVAYSSGKLCTITGARTEGELAHLLGDLLG
ncbi:UDP-N-acetylmuramoyl-tripeptide--D-alanyl-D-alanine ligase [Edaphobacillus lindanitolerans]|uniref:UDP-N-acetylmuramyl pentapeptide synthase n=1 Tax=Edaphobacillus lindanitolerans TaxID=550447 RepID=A0A1U7PNG9_9BACI|nr:UDP-N-acetylmuramoyl-tripeptide--D-alanyl-D-alanine ligase [Edaphobacillus lindanitolerans]SIT74579.1 UDP-N-acetylmuramyl pentapeptide synthase [Edaphobacillus lindanitolerans]